MLRNQGLALIALWGLALLPIPVQGADKTAANAAKIQDVQLQPRGGLQGIVVDPQGAPLDGATIVIRKGERELSRTTTDRQGRFTSEGLTTGVYTMEVAGQTQSIRVWEATAAPPSARDGATFVLGDPGTRGNFGFLDPAMATGLLLGVAGVTLAAITYSEVNGLDNDLNNTNAALNRANQKIDELSQKLDDLITAISN
jgi:hypothetical protein